MTFVPASLSALSVYLGIGMLLGALPRTGPVRWRVPGAGPGRRVDGRRVGLLVLGASMTAGAVLAPTGSWPLAAVAATGVAAWGTRGPARRRAKAVGEVHEAWPDGVRHVLASVRSGATVERALVDLAHSGPESLRRVWEPFPRLAEALGPGAAMEAVRSAAADPTTDRVVEVLIVADRIGGRVVPEILEDLADAVRADLRTLEEIRTSSLEQRLNARVVFVVPWLMLALLMSREGAYRTFYQSHAGVGIIGVAALLSVVALWIVGRLGREPIEPRVLGLRDAAAGR